MAEVFTHAQNMRGSRAQRKVERVAAAHVKTRAAVRATADGMAGIARGVLAAHHHDGHAEILRLTGDIDAYVVLSDDRGMGAAMSIEYGRKGHLNDDGELVGGMEGVAPLRVALTLGRVMGD
ncbi:DUF5403 family protein [Cellulosimicrobium sp. TH-20]|uniref:DUF5403 family protein n=1 Tax=Cellulosimicrobium sp. TH-20 TaxID=1980001 RepID=UPI0011A7C102|nr:DUF5403 family protein [Cellulosimicrobium sp. TH-20]